MLSLLALAATAGPSQRIVASFPFLNGERLAIHRRSDGRVVTLVAAGGGLFAVDIGDDLHSPQLATGTFRSQLKFVSANHDVGGKVHGLAPDILDARETAIFVAAGHAGVVRERSQHW